jgi:hypothetical protein
MMGVAMISRLSYYPGLQRWLRLLPTIAVAIVAIILPSVLLDSRKPAATQPAAPVVPPPNYDRPLGLKVTSKSQQVEILWDHGSKAIQEADKAVLRITDGNVTEAVPFDSRQLQDGALVYKPWTNDVSVRMEVNERDGRQVSESIRVVATP